MDDINNVIKGALIDSAKQLPGHDIKIFIMPVNSDNHFVIYNMEGISGISSYSGNVIIIEIDPSFTDDLLKYALAHEYHHTVALQEQEDFTESVLDRVLLEGKADIFAELVYPKVEVPWTETLSGEHMENVLKTVKENPLDPDVFDNLKYGSTEYPDYPKWSNYKLGYAIMESYLKRSPDMDPIEWTKLSSEEILVESEFNELLKK